MEQGRHKEAICKEAETLPPKNVSRESDDERNSRASLETVDTNQCIHKLVRTEQESSKRTQHKIENRPVLGGTRKKGSDDVSSVKYLHMALMAM